MTTPDSSGEREQRPGALSVVRPAASGEGPAFETFIKITSDGSVTAYNGHVDLGTGIRTALGQIVAEELDVSFARVVVVLGDTSRVPRPSSVTMSRPAQPSIGITQARAATPSISTAQAPHSPSPQPYFGPFNARSLRST